VSELDITGGDQSKVGYFAGLIVRHSVFGPDLNNLKNAPGVSLLRDRSAHRSSME